MSGRAPTAAEETKPALIWVKAQAPGVHKDGSSMVTAGFARELTQKYDLHLVCLATPATPDGLSCEDFTSTNLVVPAHRRSTLSRHLLMAWYWLLDIVGVRARNDSIQSSRPVQREIARLRELHKADICLGEYWPTARAVDRSHAKQTILIAYDVEHRNVLEMVSDEQFSSRPTRHLLHRRRRRHELRALRRVTDAIYLSLEDQADFVSAGGPRGSVATVPIGDTRPLRVSKPQDEPILVALGNLDWLPNRDGLIWFVEQVLPLIRHRNPDVRVRLIGDSAPERHGIDPDDVEAVGYVDKLLPELATGAVGIVPVRFGTGVKTKTLDMLAAGLPIVATSRGIRGTSASIAGAIVADHPNAFAAGVSLLLQSPAERDRVKKAGRIALQNGHFSAAAFSKVGADRLTESRSKPAASRPLTQEGLPT